MELNNTNIERNRRRTLSGNVISDKMDKTRVVEIQTFKKHPLYGKRLKVNKKYKMHDENNESKIGDIVLMRETRKLSKDKYFTLVRIKEKSKYSDIQEIIAKEKELARKEKSIKKEKELGKLKLNTKKQKEAAKKKVNAKKSVAKKKTATKKKVT